MSGLCSAHKHFEKGCLQCEAMTDDELLKAFADNLIANQTDLPPEFLEVLDDNFEDLLA